jgi:hypothetical protein
MQSQPLTFELSDQTAPNVTLFVSYETLLGTLRIPLVVRPKQAGRFAMAVDRNASGSLESNCQSKRVGDRLNPQPG